MPKPPSQSVPYERAVEVPEAEILASQASGWASRTVITVALIMLAGLVLLCMIGPHIPSGE